MSTNPSDIRFELILFYFPDEEAVRQSCQLIYQSQDKNLVASLHSTPYTVGRSFSRPEQEQLSEALKALKVGFQFRSKPPYHENIHYDPRSPKSSTENGSNFRISKNAIIFASAIAVVIVLAILLAQLAPTTKEIPLKTERTKPVTQASKAETEYDAWLDQIKPKVEYRSGHDLFWKEASKGQELKLDDGVRTFSRASALIRYLDGSFVRLRENTLLVVGETYQSVETGTEREVELKDGSLQARLQASEARQKLSIKTPQGTLEISNQEKQQPASTQINTSFKNGELQIAVSEGAAQFLPKNKNSLPLQIQKLQKVTQKADQQPQISSYTPEIQIYQPEADTIFKLRDTGENQFTFEWEDLGSEVEYEWTLWADAAGKDLLLSQRTSHNSLHLSFLDVGTLYWKVEASKEGITYSSALYRIYVEKHHN